MDLPPLEPFTPLSPLYRWLTWGATRIVSRFARQGWFRKTPGPVAGWTAHRDFAPRGSLSGSVFAKSQTTVETSA
ncbi:MAG: hypothetical protein U0903_22705 [Planctomycetales bacterium]